MSMRESIDTYREGFNRNDSFTNILVRADVTDYAIGRVFGQLITLPGVHLVDLEWSRSEDSELAAKACAAYRDAIAKSGEEFDADEQDMWIDVYRERADWRRFYVRATENATRKVRAILATVRNADQDADHDHDKCVRDAAAMGVPPTWAHMPETYLSM